MSACTCQTVSEEYSDHRHQCPVYIAGRAARLANASSRLNKLEELAKRIADVTATSAFRQRGGKSEIHLSQAELSVIIAAAVLHTLEQAKSF